MSDKIFLLAESVCSLMVEGVYMTNIGFTPGSVLVHFEVNSVRSLKKFFVSIEKCANCCLKKKTKC